MISENGGCILACFLVPAGEAVVTSVAEKIIKNDKTKISFARKLSWLTKLLAGGSVLLAFEHVWHGEVVPFFPFLSAASNPEDFAEMIHEMGTVGVTMTGIVTFVWICMVIATGIMEKNIDKSVSLMERK